MRGKTLCYHHGGKSVSGTALPQFKTGRYSKYLPERLLERYQASLDDENTLELREEVALIDSRLADVLERADTGESRRLWSDLQSTYRELQQAEAAGNKQDAKGLLFRIGQIIGDGARDSDAWEEVRSLIRDRQRLVESERKRLIEAERMIAVDQAVALLVRLLDAVQESGDERVYRTAVEAFVRITGIAPALAASSHASRDKEATEAQALSIGAGRDPGRDA